MYRMYIREIIYSPMWDAIVLSQVAGTISAPSHTIINLDLDEAKGDGIPIDVAGASLGAH